MTVRARVSSVTPRPVRRAVKLGVRAVYTLPTSRFRLLPDFLIIGAQRAGTTSLYRYLARHPAVGPVVLTKGAHYFDTNYDKGLDWYRAHFPTRWTKARAKRRLGVDLITGEGSPYYVFHPLAPARIAETLPEAKFLLMLRDPVERAYSHYQHELARGFEDLSFEEALEAEPERLAGERERMIQDPTYNSFEHQHHSYLARGRYLEQIQVWRALFPADRMLIITMEEFFSNPEPGFERVLRFLDLPAWRPERFERYNARRYSQMDPATRARLVDHFAEPNRELARFLGIDPGWSD
jgi:hypothetical protein